MEAKKNSDEKKRVTFSKEIDSIITGYALGISLLGIGVFLFLKPTYFAIPLISYITGAIFGVLGVLGIGVELSKSSTIKGLGNFILGMIFFAAWLVVYILVNKWWTNLMSLAFLILGCYAICLGIFQGIYSIILIIRETKKAKDAKQEKGKWEVAVKIVLFLTQLCALVVAMLNALKAAGVFQK